MSDRPYSRLYWEVMDDAKFDGVRDNPRHFGTWALLLVVADMAWPASAFIPTMSPKASVALLAERELVDILPGGRYRIHGLDRERNQRSDKARAAVSTRWNGRKADAVQKPYDRTTDHVLAETSTSQAEPSRADGREVVAVEVDEGYDSVVRWLSSRKAWVDSPKIQTDLARLVDRNGAVAVLGAMNALLPDVTEAAQFVYGARNLLHPLPRSNPRDADRQERADEDRRHHEAALARTRRDLDESERRARELA